MNSLHLYLYVMTQSLPEAFLREVSETVVATERRIARRISHLPQSDSEGCNQIVQDELCGLYHGILVMFDGGTGLADVGLIQIVDEAGDPFDRNLHEIGFRQWPE